MYADHGYMHHILNICIMGTCIMDTNIMDTYTMDTCIIDTFMMDTCITRIKDKEEDKEVWVTRPERPKGAKDKVK